MPQNPFTVSASEVYEIAAFPTIDRLEGAFASLGANGLYIDQRPPQSRAQMRELRAVWAQAARVEAMRAARRAAVAEADGEATDDEAEAAAEEDELPLGCI